MVQRITSSQLRAARGLLDWSCAQLAELSGVSEPTIHRIETGAVQPHEKSIASIIRAFGVHGVEFSENDGLRRRPDGVEIYEGPERFDEFYEFLYEHLKTHGGEVCLSVTDERLLAKYRKDSELHRKRMKDLCERGIIKSFRVLANKSNFSPWYATHKLQPGPALSPTAFYAFGDCLALISFAHPIPPYVVVLQSAPLANSYRQAFDIAWKAAKEPPKKA
jgi:transcriptional regulator with XRE-family HTH domain